jgi:hypothetical protein
LPLHDHSLHFPFSVILNQIFDAVYVKQEESAAAVVEPTSFISATPYFLESMLLKEVMISVQEKEKIFDYCQQNIDKQKARQMYVLNMRFKVSQSSMLQNVFRIWVYHTRNAKKIQEIAKRMFTAKNKAKVQLLDTVWREWKIVHNKQRLTKVPGEKKRL